MAKGGRKGQTYDIDNGTHEQMLDARETCAHTKNNDRYVYRAEDAEFIRILEKAIPARFDESQRKAGSGT